MPIPHDFEEYRNSALRVLRRYPGLCLIVQQYGGAGGEWGYTLWYRTECVGGAMNPDWSEEETYEKARQYQEDYVEAATSGSAHGGQGTKDK